MMRVAVVSPEPTPYRSPLFDRLGERPDLELTVVYSARAQRGHGWKVVPRHRAVFLRGRTVPGLHRVFRHDYAVTLGVGRVLADLRPDVVVVSGWSTFADQAAIAWCLRRGIPYVLLVESHDVGPRSRWRAAIKDAFVPRVVGRAAGVLVVGSLARASMIQRGANSSRIGIFANTIDVDAFAARSDALRARRDEFRVRLGLKPEDVAVLSVARLSPEKGLDVLLRAAAQADPRLVVVLVGEGPERVGLERLAASLGTRAVFVGSVPWNETVEAYVACDVFALLSWRETWGVVVNEAAACGLPLVVSDRVGSAPDLVADGENGIVVPAGDAAAAAEALGSLVEDSTSRERRGARSRARVRNWGYQPSIESFVRIVGAAAHVVPSS